MSDTATQEKHAEWHYQWTAYEDTEAFLFFDWIQPRTVEDFRDKHVLDAGCGPGHHTRLVAPVARAVTAMDLNTGDIARARLAAFQNIRIVEADIATYSPNELYDVIYCIGVIHHTDNPDKTFANLKAMLRPGGLLIIWCYSREGNELVWRVVEPVRKYFLRHLSRPILGIISNVVTALMYPIVHTVYRLPLRFLPFYEYFENFRRLSFRRNMLNVFDKLNAPQTDFIAHDRIARWFNPAEFGDVSLTPYKGVSWRGSGVKK
jgi:SAM-dependent methyltransferase